MPFKPSPRMLTLAFIVYLVFIGGATYAVTNPVLRGLHHLLMTLVLVGWLVMLIRQRRPLPGSALDIPLVAYVIWLGVTLITAQDWRVSLEQSWALLLHVLGLYLLITLMGRRWLFEGLFLVAALVVLISIVELASWYFGLGFGGFQHGWLAVGGWRNPIPPQFYRLQLAFNVATWLGNFVVLVLPMTLAWALTARKRDDRRALLLVCVGLIWVLIFSLSRGALLGMVAVIGIWGFLRFILPAHRWRGVALAGLVIVGLVGAGVVYRLSQSRGASDQGRVILWENALEMIEAHPLTGAGVYGFGYYLHTHNALDSNTDHLKTAHNLYLNTAAEIGIPGVGLMLWLGGAFLLAWWRSWQGASPAQRIRLEGILAALGGFCVQSLVDTFTFTSSVLPLLIGAAYVLAQQPPTPPTRAHYRLRYAALVGVLGFFIWLARVDLAQFRLLQSTLAGDNYTAALEKVEAAQRLDPHLRLYDLQRADLLGRLARQDPAYLEQAITAYTAALQADPAFHVGQVNLAALYAQAGDYTAAIQAVQAALASRPDMNFYWLKLGEYYEAAGDDSAATAAYRRALLRSPLIPQTFRSYIVPLARSHFWDTPTPARQQALAQVYQEYDHEQRGLFAVQVRQAMPPGELGRLAWGLYANRQGRYADAVTAFEQVANDENAWTYAQLAEAYWGLGDTQAAEKAARRALFLDPVLGARARYVLVQIGVVEPEQINRYLIRAVNPRFVVHAYDEAVFGHIAFLDYLPQVEVPGVEDFEPWFLLAERYATDADSDTDPADVYQAMLDIDPYFEAARAACGAACID